MKCRSSRFVCRGRARRRYTSPHVNLRFSSFIIDLQRLSLTRKGEVVVLSPNLVALLAYFASKPGELITRDELLDRFWPDVHVAPNTVDRSVNRLREGIGDNGAKPLFIQTVPRRGYRFIGIVDGGGAPGLPDVYAEWDKGLLSLEALDAEQLDDVTAMFEGMLQTMPDNAGVHTLLANAYFLQYERTRPENIPNRVLLERAICHARKACELDARSGEAHGALGFALLEAGDMEQARATARRATEIQPANWRNHFRLAIACWGQQRLNAVNRTLVEIPDFAPAYFVASMVYIARQSFPAAEELVARGAALQTQDAQRHSPYPAVGLHWLQGQLHLRTGAIDAALASFAREINEGRRTGIYYREFHVNALIGMGYAHLAAKNPTAAGGAFQQALAIVPRNGRALLGLQQVAMQGGSRADYAALAGQLNETLAELASGARVAEAAVLKAAVEAMRGNTKAACDVLDRLLQHAPSGQVGWMMPIDFALAALRDDPRFKSTLALLAARAR